MKTHYPLLIAAAFLTSSCDRTSPVFHIGAGSGAREAPLIVVSGYGWPAGSDVEIWGFGEPIRDGADIYSGPPRLIGTIKVSAYGDLGDPPKGVYFPRPQLCGAKPQYISPWYVAMTKDKKIQRIPTGDTGHLSFSYFKTC